MALYSIQGDTLGDIADAIREQTGTEDPIQTNNMSAMIRKIEGGSPNAVLYIEQILTDEQKAQARQNIGAAAIGEGGNGSAEGAVLYTEQNLEAEQKAQARENIDIHVGEEPVDADEGAIWIDPNGADLILGNAIFAEDTNDGEVEIFGSFISEDTVVAKDKNSDGNINLQAFVIGEGPVEEYVTKEDLEALTAEDVGARPDTWTPTAEDVGAITMELLWENASPGSGFDAQTIVLDLTNAEMVLIEFRTTNTSSSRSYVFGKVGSQTALTELMMISTAGSYFVAVTRTASISTTGITFSTGYSKNPTATAIGENTSRAIPTKVYAIKGVR